MLTIIFQVLGNINLPGPLNNFGDVESGGIGKLLNVILKTLVTVGGLYALINLILAGYSFMSAGEDTKKVEGAWAKIWQTLLGLAFVAGSIVLAAIFGKLLFDDYDFILRPEIPKV